MIRACPCGALFRANKRKTTYCSAKCTDRGKCGNKAFDKPPPTPEQIRYCNVVVFGSLGIIYDGASGDVWTYCLAEQNIKAKGRKYGRA